MLKRYLFYLIVLISIAFNGQTFWTGDFISFSKEPNVDWTLEENQDRITDNVWLTRKNSRSIFNIVTESGSTGTSPSNTEWAFGQISDDVSTLTFDTFANTMNGAIGDNVLTDSLVLHIISEDIYIDVVFNQWSRGRSGGGFAYRRSTPEDTASSHSFEIKELEIYPNPAKDQVRISGLQKSTLYVITNMLGSVVDKGNLDLDQSISIQKLKKGIYFIEINNEVLKFVKK